MRDEKFLYFDGNGRMINYESNLLHSKNDYFLCKKLVNDVFYFKLFFFFFSRLTVNNEKE